MSGKRRSRDDSRHQFADAFLNYESELKRYLRSRLGNHHDAQDLAQESYLRLSRVKEQNLIRSPEAYLFRIANNLVNELLIERNKSSAQVELEADEEEAHDHQSFEGTLEHREMIQRLEHILDDLPPLYRTVLVLRKRDGYSHEEIAKLLNISTHTVHTYLKRAVLKCRANWTE